PQYHIGFSRNSPELAFGDSMLCSPESLELVIDQCLALNGRDRLVLTFPHSIAPMPPLTGGVSPAHRHAGMPPPSYRQGHGPAPPRQGHVGNWSPLQPSRGKSSESHAR